MKNSPSILLRSFVDRLLAPVDIAYLACVRIAFGAMLTWLLVKFIWADVPRSMFIEPAFYFSYRWFEWVTPLPGAGMYVLLFLLLLFALCITVGLAYRLAIWLFFAGWTYYFLIDPAYYMNHFYMVGLLAFLLGLMPANSAASLDAMMRPALRSSTTPAWTIWAIRAQIGIVYFYAGVTKLHPDWLSGAVIRTAIGSWANASPVLNVVGVENAVWFMSYSGLLLDLMIVPGLLWRRTRLLSVVVIGSFHLMNSMLFNIDIFPLMAFALTLSYFNPGWPRFLLNRLTFVRVRAQKRAKSAPTASPTGVVQRPNALLAVLAVYFAVQVLVPLRHFAYSGDHNWTDEGHQFSWNLMSRVKEGRVAFIATDTKSGTNLLFDPENYLGTRQVRWQATDPQLILQFAHFIGERMHEQGYDEVEVRAFSKVSMNGRPPQYFVNPETDLTTIRPWQRTAGWLMPIGQPSPAD